MDEMSTVGGRFCIIAHTAEGEFVWDRYDSGLQRDRKLSAVKEELEHDLEMVCSGAPHTLYFSDDVIKFSKRDDDDGTGS